MPKSTPPRFSRDTLAFLKKAGRQKSDQWLEKNRAEYEKLLQLPLTHLASTLKAELGSLARDYHFPQKGLGRLKRSANRAREYGSLYKDWVSYSAAQPRKSRFDHNPNLFFLIQSDDEEDPVLVAGGLYMPSSRQLRSIREAIAHDAKPFEQLFRSKEFAACFKGGFSDEKKATRPPRGFDPNHPKIDWLKLQAYFVWKPYTMKQFASPGFADLFARDCRQILKLNRLLESVIGNGTRPARLEQPRAVTRRETTQSASLLERLESL